LNETGTQATLANKAVIENTIRQMTSLASEREHGQNLGDAMDELVRHHPSLRPLVYETSMSRIDADPSDSTSLIKASRIKPSRIKPC
jgi:hypothetical protein